jgi:GNAT superfamily N-acetyltransferase
MGMEQNTDKAWGWVLVDPDRRGDGLGRKMMSELAGILEANGRRLFTIRLLENFYTAPLADRAGMRPALSMKRSRLRIEDLDMDLMRAWIARASERASDYEILSWTTPIPDEHLKSFCELTEVMNTAPLEDLEEDPETTSPELWRQIEESLEKSGEKLLVCVARHRTTSEFAGYTDLKYQGHFPQIAWQWDTGVHPDHRNRGLGRWLKATMTGRVVETHPAVQYIDTFNAGSNEPMLNINIEMGFLPLATFVNWQGETAAIREKLGI